MKKEYNKREEPFPVLAVLPPQSPAARRNQASRAACGNGTAFCEKENAMSNIQFTLGAQGNAAASANLLYVTASRYEEGHPCTPHTHYFSEFFYVTRGEGEFWAEGETYPLREDDLVVVNPNMDHTERPTGPGPLEYVMLGAEGLAFDFTGRGGWNSCGLFHCRAARDEIRFFLGLLLSELEKKGRDYEFVCQNALQCLLVFLQREWGEGLAISSPKRTAKECSAVKRYIDANFREALTLDRLAEISHLNKYYLAHAFREHIGLSPISYLNSRRVDEAKSLLRSTNYSISQIADSIGFSSQSYFAQVFQKAAGKSPGEYRKSLRRGPEAAKETEE